MQKRKKEGRDDLLQNEMFWALSFNIQLLIQIKKYLQKNNLSQTEFAHIINVPDKTMSQIMNAEADLEIRKIIEICLVMGIAPELEFIGLKQVLQ